MNLSHTSDLYHHSKHYKDRAYLRSLSTFPHDDLDKPGVSHQLQFSRLLSMHHRLPEHFEDYPMTREDFLHAFHKGNESDEADDEDDDERTPTVERAELKFQ